MPRLCLDDYFIEMLALVAQRSTCARRRVGAIITDRRGRVLSTGYNGVPSGFPHCIDTPCIGVGDPKGDSSRCMAVHAEQNALLQCHNLNDARNLYVSCNPCFTCAKMICNTDIERIIFPEHYIGDTLGLDLLSKSGRILVFKECE